jgi:hypothetical protein
MHKHKSYLYYFYFNSKFYYIFIRNIYFYATMLQLQKQQIKQIKIFQIL